MMRFIAVCAVLTGGALTLCGCNDGSGDTPSDTSANETNPTKTEDPPLPVAAATGADQMTETKLHALLKKKNPQYKGNGQFAPADGPFVAVSLSNTEVSDLSPLAGMDLQFLELANTKVNDLSPLRGMQLQALDLYKVNISDISPLKGMPLTKLLLEETSVSDISPLKGMQLKDLWLNGTSVRDISPLAKMPIEKLNLFGTKVEDLTVLQTLPLNTIWLRDVPATDFSPLEGLFLESLDVQGTAFGDDDLALIKGMPVQRLNIAETNVTDLTPLKNLQLTRLIFTPSRIRRGLDIVREMNSLRELDATFRQPKRLQPAEFWAKYDAGEFNRPKN